MVDRWGWTGRLALRRGQTVAQAIAAAPGIESALSVRPGAVRVEPDPVRADRAVLRVIESDPLAAPVPWPGVPGSPTGQLARSSRRFGTAERGRAPSILDPIDLGVHEDGTGLLVRLAYRNVLIGGAIGSGKSGVLNVLMAALVAARDVAVWGIDLKGGMELGPWASCLGRLATTPADAVALVRDALAVRDHRTATARARLWDPAQDGPALVLVVDEYAELPEEAKDLLESLARLGRAVMVNILAATQRPTVDTMGGGATRAQMAIRVCLGVSERRDTDLILDRGAWAAGWRADLLDAPGKMLLRDPEHTIPRPARGYLITDENVSGTATDYAAAQPAIPIPYTPDDPYHENPKPSLNTIREGDRRDTGTGSNGNSGSGYSSADSSVGDSSQRDIAPLDRLWEALQEAPAEGVPVAELCRVTGKGRTWVYDRLREHAAAGRAAPTGASRGRWRTTAPPSPPPLSDNSR